MKRKHLRKLTIFIVIFVNFSIICNASPLDSIRTSFQEQNKKSDYISFSFGMGINYCNNNSLIDFIELQIPDYNTIPQNERFSQFSTGLEFFGGVEYQISRNFSIKGDYSYFIKSINISRFQNYDYSYINHQPYIILNYIIPQEYFFLKIGGGVGYFMSHLTVKEFGYQQDYSSSGVGLKLEGIFNAQISKNVASYLSGFITQSFQSDLKDGNDVVLKSRDNSTVNLSSFGLGLRLGLEVFIF